MKVGVARVQAVTANLESLVRAFTQIHKKPVVHRLEKDVKKSLGTSIGHARMASVAITDQPGKGDVRREQENLSGAFSHNLWLEFNKNVGARHR
jgi:hypothetical protein